MDTKEDAQQRLIDLTLDLDQDQENRLDVLGHIRLIEHQADKLRRAVILEAREAHTTWREIGDALNVTPQSAQERFGKDARLPIQVIHRGP